MSVSLPRNGSEWHSESLFLFFVARKGIPNSVLFRGMVRNGIPRICIYIGSMERNFVSDFLKTYLSVRYWCNHVNVPAWSYIQKTLMTSWKALKKLAGSGSVIQCFSRRVRNRIMGVCFYFCSSERNSEVIFSSAEGFGTEFRDFLFRGTTGIPSEITSCSVNSVFRGIIFLSEIPNPTCPVLSRSSLP